MTWRNTFDSLLELGTDEVTLHRLKGYVTSGGHNRAVFEPAETVRLVIRPWQSDMMRVEDEGQTGHTPGVKIYADAAQNLKRNDRIHYNGGEFRLMNPQFDQLNDLYRWDGQTDERQLLLEEDVDGAYEIDPPDTGGYGGT